MQSGLNMDETRIASGRLSQFGAVNLKHRDARSVYRLWSRLRGARKTPFRAELDADSIGARAPYLAILESVGAANFRIRLAGDRINRWFGMELRGMSALAMIGPDGRNHLLATLHRVTAEPAVAVVHGQARRPDGLISRFELMLLPMRSDFGRVDRVLAGMWLLDAEPLTNGPFACEATEFTVAQIDEAATEELGDLDADGDDAPSATDAAVEESRLRIAALREKVAALLSEDGAEYESLEDPAPTSPTPLAEPSGGFRPIEGGGGGDGVRRGHLRLVKGD